jgi:hypothetical protein
LAENRIDWVAIASPIAAIRTAAGTMPLPDLLTL